MNTSSNLANVPGPGAAALRRAWRPHLRGNLGSGVRWWLLTLGALLIGLWLLFKGQGSLLGAAVAFLGLMIIAIADVESCVLYTLAFLIAMGDLRRILVYFVGLPTLDPMLLVGPLATLVIALPILMRIRLKDASSKLAFALLCIMTLEIFNPRQGPIMTGMTGAMFCIIPVLWYWIGRKYGSIKLLQSVIYRVILPLGLVAACMGLYQSYIGFLPWQGAWASSVASHYHSLYLASGVIRSFGFSVNSVEYANLLLMASTVSLSAFFSGKRVYVLFFPLLATALFLASSRSAIIKLLVAVAFAWSLSGRPGQKWALRFAFAIVIAFGGMAYSLSQVVPENTGPAVEVRTRSKSAGQNNNEAVTASTQHQLLGLAHPLDKKYSTAQGHADMFSNGLLQGIKNPIGIGIGSVTMASGNAKLGTENAGGEGSTEVDISDMFVSTGLVGGLLYVAFIIVFFRKIIEFGQGAPKSVGLPALGIVAALLGTWIAAGQYAIGPTVWFIIGAISASQFAIGGRTLQVKSKAYLQVDPPGVSEQSRPN